MAEDEIKMKANEWLALIAAVVTYIDSLTTYIAVRFGAVELNPIVSLFLANDWLYSLFASLKSSLALTVTYYVFREGIDFRGAAVFAIVMFLFIRAIIINMINIMVLV